VKNWGDSVEARLGSIQYSDGTIWDTDAINQLAFAHPILGTAGNDSLGAWIGESATIMRAGVGDDYYTVKNSANLVEESPPRQNSCRLHRTKNPGAAMKDRSGSIRTSIQG
jgi:hypothetical protein